MRSLISSLLLVAFVPSWAKGFATGQATKSFLTTPATAARVTDNHEPQRLSSELYASTAMPYPGDRGSSNNNRARQLQKQKKSTKISPLSALTRFLRSYKTNLETRPLITKAWTAGLVCGLGCALQQVLEASITAKKLSAAAAAAAAMGGAPVASVAASVAKFSWNEVAVFFCMGCFFKGPYYHYWFEHLDRIQFPKVLRERIPRLPMQIGMDQTVGVVLFYPAYFLMYEVFLSALSFHFPNLHRLSALLKDQFWTVISAQYMLWPAFQTLNFKFVPQNLRVLATNLVAVLWNCYFCARIAAGVA